MSECYFSNNFHCHIHVVVHMDRHESPGTLFFFKPWNEIYISFTWNEDMTDFFFQFSISGICHHSAATANILHDITAIATNLWQFLLMMSIIPSKTENLRHSPAKNILQQISAISGNLRQSPAISGNLWKKLSIAFLFSLVPVAAGDCWSLRERRLPALYRSFLLVCRTLPHLSVSAREWRHLPETAGTCRGQPTFAGVFCSLPE